jgi:hypothetical protein
MTEQESPIMTTNTSTEHTPICPACETYDPFCICERPRYVVARYNSTTFEIQDTHTNTAPHVKLSFDDAARLMHELNAA